MSQAAIERVLGKVLLDTCFRDALLANPDEALAGFALTGREKNYLKCMDAETLDQLAALLTRRNQQWQSAAAPKHLPKQN